MVTDCSWEHITCLNQIQVSNIEMGREEKNGYSTLRLAAYVDS